jgi:hypothetical protein
MKLSLIVILFASFAWAGCSPKIYLHDRHTIMEEESAGEWPDFEKELLKSATQKSPTAFQKTELSNQKKRLFNVLNGELLSRQESTK